jgi:hypothetical protein
MFRWLKGFRRIGTRYDKLDIMFSVYIYPALSLIVVCSLVPGCVNRPYYKLYTKLRETGLVGKYSPQDIIEMSKAVYHMKIGGSWHLAEVTAKVRKLLAKAGIDYLT